MTWSQYMPHWSQTSILTSSAAYILWRGVVGRGRKIQCAAARRQILGTLARPRRGHQGKSQNPLHFLHHGAVRIYLKGAHRIQRTAPTVCYCGSGNSCREGAEGPICAKRRRPYTAAAGRCTSKRKSWCIATTMQENPLLLLTISGRERMCTCWSSSDAQIRVWEEDWGRKIWCRWHIGRLYIYIYINGKKVDEGEGEIPPVLFIPFRYSAEERVSM